MSKLKKCKKCFELKALEEYYSHNSNKDGKNGKCKACYDNERYSYSLKNIGTYRAYSRKYAHSEKGTRLREEYQKNNKKRRNAAAYRRFKALPKEVAVAYKAVSKAKRTGTLIPEPCEVCGKTKVEGHHEDYSKPLEVIWLCRRHHAKRHRKVK